MRGERDSNRGYHFDYGTHHDPAIYSGKIRQNPWRDDGDSEFGCGYILRRRAGAKLLCKSHRERDNRGDSHGGVFRDKFGIKFDEKIAIWQEFYLNFSFKFIDLSNFWSKFYL